MRCVVMTATTPHQVFKAVGVIVLRHVTDFGTNWTIETAVQVMAW